MSTRLYSYREGDRGEYLTQYVLSALGLSVPVPRQEDVGIDFHCSLAQHLENNLVRFDSPYLVQAKNVSELKKGILFGKITKSKNKPKYREYEVDWLFAQDLPLLVTFADLKKHVVHIYNTAGIWTAYLQSDHCAQVLLQPREPEAEETGIAGHGSVKATELEGIRDESQWHIPLGLPLVSIHIDDLVEPSKRIKFINILRFSNAIERNNITYRNLGIPYAVWFTNIKPNDLESMKHFGGMYAKARESGDQSNPLIDALIPLFISMAYNYHIKDQKKEFESLRDMAKLISKDRVPEFILPYVGELFD